STPSSVRTSLRPSPAIPPCGRPGRPWSASVCRLRRFQQRPNRRDGCGEDPRLRIDRLEVACTLEGDELGLARRSLDIGGALGVRHAHVGVSVDEYLADTEW